MEEKEHSNKESPLEKEKPRENKKGTGYFFAKKGGLDESSPKYEKPLFEKSKGMNFTTEIWKKFAGGRFCMQCSACHGCR